MSALTAFDIFYFQDNENFGEKRIFIQSSRWTDNLISSNSKDLRRVLTHISSALPDPNERKRYDGLLLLDLLIEQNKGEVFEENFRTWIAPLRNIILHDVDHRLRLLSAKIFAEILLTGAVEPEHSRYLSTNVIPNVIPQLLELSDKFELVVANLLLASLKALPGSCRQYLFSIQKRVLQLLVSNNDHVVALAAACVSILPFIIGRSGEKSVSESSAWLQLFTKFLCGLHANLNFLFDDVESDTPHTIDIKDQILLPFHLGEEGATSAFKDTFRRVLSINLCLQKLLSNGGINGSITLPVPVESILDVIRRILNINEKLLAVRISENNHAIMLNSVLPILHSQAFKLLECLVLCCRNHLLLHDQTVLSLIAGTLQQWTCSRIRDDIYRILILWLQVVSGTDFRRFGDEIVKQILSDIWREDRSVEMAKSGSVGKGARTKSKRRKMEVNLAGNPKPVGARQFRDETSCLLALKALRTVLNTVAEDLKGSTLKNIHSKISRIALALNHNVVDVSTESYKNQKCRSTLYKVLLSIVVIPSLTNHSILATAISAFSVGKADLCPKVSAACTEALNTCRLIVEPLRRHLPESGTSRDTLDTRSCQNDMDDDHFELESIATDVVMTNGVAKDFESCRLQATPCVRPASVESSIPLDRMQLDSGMGHCISTATFQQESSSGNTDGLESDVAVISVDDDIDSETSTVVRSTSPDSVSSVQNSRTTTDNEVEVLATFSSESSPYKSKASEASGSPVNRNYAKNKEEPDESFSEASPQRQLVEELDVDSLMKNFVDVGPDENDSMAAEKNPLLNLNGKD